MVGMTQVMLGSSGIPLSASITPTSITASRANGAAYSGTATANASGGSGSYTYAWSWQSGGTNITLGATTSATCTLNSAGTNNVTRSGVLRCIVTDAVFGTSVTNTIPVEITWGTA